jgi:CRISPR/Cas system-associated endonuclease Cas1
LINAKLEPFLGFLHSEQFNKPSLVCDLMELYRFLFDDFLIQGYSGLVKKVFVTKYEALTRKKIGKREYLNDVDSKDLMREFNRFFESHVEIPRMKVGKRQTLETLISEEALLLAKFLRNEKREWNPRLPVLSPCLKP